MSGGPASFALESPTENDVRQIQTEYTTREALARPMTLPVDSQERKRYPMSEGVLKYFPAALAGVARISKIGNDKHNPGQPLHHARGKSMDHADCIVRHLMDVHDLLAKHSPDPDMVLIEASQLAWRALAYSQLLHERYGAPLAPGAKTTLKEKE